MLLGKEFVVVIIRLHYAFLLYGVRHSPDRDVLVFR